MQLLMIEDNEDDYLLLSRYAAKIGDIDLKWCNTLAHGLAHLANNPIDVLLLDLALPDGTGLENLDRMQGAFPALPIIILSGNDNDVLSVEAVQHGAQDYLAKDHIDERILKKSISYAVERKRIEQALVAERNMLRTMIDSMPDYIFFKDAEGRVIITNQANAELVGVSPQEVIGKTAYEIFPPELAEEYDADDRYVLQSGKPLINIEREITDTSGAVKSLLATKIPLHDKSGQVSGVVSISHDITEQKQTERKLRDDHNLLRTVIDNVPDYIFVKDTDSRLTLANRAVIRDIGAENLDEVIGKSDFDILPHDLAEKFYAEEQELLRSGEPLINKVNQIIVHAEDSPRWVLSTKIPLLDSDGNIVGLVGINRDITERKRIDEKLRQERDLLRALIDSTPDYIFVKDAQGRLVITNEAHAQMAGTTPDALIGKTASDLFPPELAQQYHVDDNQVMQTGAPLINIERDIIDTSGKIKTLLITKIPLQDESGQNTGLVSISRDITVRKQIEEKLRQERDLLRALIDSTPDYIFIKDAQERFIISNKAHARAVNVSPGELVGKTAFDVFPPEFAEQYNVDDRRVIETGEPLINIERDTINEHGKTLTVLTSKIPLLDKDGRVTSVVGISRDITEHKELEARSMELAGERERIRVLQRFIDDMSHDLRTPLSVISSSMYLLQKNTEPDKQQAHIEKIERQLLRFDKLLNEMLEMAELDRHTMKLQVELTEINAFLKTLCQEYEAIAREEQLTLEFLPDEEACPVRIDKAEFANAIIKLLDNAISYTPQGGSIKIRTHTQQNETVVSVQDDGIGIAEKDLPHIFERFYRADEARSTTTGGHGLGLSIAQSIIEAHGGSLKAKSTLGQGSTFFVTLLTN